MRPFAAAEVREAPANVAGKQGNGFTDDSVVYRIEYATTFTPYTGPMGRVANSCLAGADNPFTRAARLAPGGPCPGQPTGTACEDGDPCNGLALVGGITPMPVT